MVSNHAKLAARADWTLWRAIYVEDPTLTLADIAQRAERSYAVAKRIAVRQRWDDERDAAQAERRVRIRGALRLEIEQFEAGQAKQVMDLFRKSLRRSLDQLDQQDRAKPATAFELEALLRMVQSLAGSGGTTILTIPPVIFAVMPEEEVKEIEAKVLQSLESRKGPTSLQGATNGHAPSPYSQLNSAS